MNKYIINDNKKIIFLKNNEVLFGDVFAKRKVLTREDYILLKELCKKYRIFDESNCSKTLLNLLKKHKLVSVANNQLIDTFNTPQERTELFYNNFFKSNNRSNLKDKSVLFIGTGGIASEIIDQLIGVGIRKYIIIDFDKVDVSNLNRQFVYSLEDIGKEKIEIFKKYILSKNSDAIIVTYSMFLNSEKDLEEIINDNKIDIIINSADTPIYRIQRIIANCSIKYDIPCMFGGVGIFEGTFGPLLSNKKNKVSYLCKIDMLLNKIESVFPCKSSFGVTNTLIATYMSWDIIMFLLNKKKYVKSLNREIKIDFRSEKI